jgi:hypothetical protein
MMYKENNMKVYRLPKPAREKAKFHDSVANHSNANVRIAADNLALAFKAAKSGNVQDVLTHLSLAQMFAEKVLFINPEENR